MFRCRKFRPLLGKLFFPSSGLDRRVAAINDVGITFQRRSGARVFLTHEDTVSLKRGKSGGLEVRTRAGDVLIWPELTARDGQGFWDALEAVRQATPGAPLYSRGSPLGMKS